MPHIDGIQEHTDKQESGVSADIGEVITVSHSHPKYGTTPQSTFMVSS